MFDHIKLSNQTWYCRKHKEFFDDGKSCSECPAIKSKVHDRKVYTRKVRNSIWERFHNYGVKFVADVDWNNINIVPTRLNNNVFYKRLDFPSAYVKVFRKSILVTLKSSSEIKGLSVREAEYKSKLLVNEVLDLLPMSIMIKDRSVVNLHNAFVNHPTATHDVTVSVNGEVRAISDHSKGYDEFEFVNPSHAISDSEILENFNRDLIVNNPESLSVQSNKINHVVNILDKYAMQMDLHLAVEQKTSDTLDKMNIILSQMISNKKSNDRRLKRSLGVTSPRCHRC